MASVKVNEAKRAEMARLVSRIRDSGWCIADLAAYMRVTPGTVSAWARGASMGTNAQRAKLADIRSPEEERPCILILVAQLENELQRRAKLAGEATERGAHHVAKSHLRAVPAIRARVETLRGIAKENE